MLGDIEAGATTAGAIDDSTAAPADPDTKSSEFKGGFPQALQKCQSEYNVNEAGTDGARKDIDGICGDDIDTIHQQRGNNNV